MLEKTFHQFLISLFYAKRNKPDSAHVFIKFQPKLFRKTEVKTTEIYSFPPPKVASETQKGKEQ